ncbi:hypothetical protein NRK68_35465 (plasmid) [Streptomyces yangpuensis]|uniref:Uncharacterized protein n=1 Tax=Streptomyces yangpuensis TaxID=1648182 RepID=A0ABY5QAA5_9ACTN|nr:hypothetical protein [Streptomyces yangpuensis]UUY52563.1 hypothetical protein NRK68_35465 [Streptomyces yangpuensis]
MTTMTRARCPYEIGGTVTGWTVVPPEGRTRRQPEQVTGTVVQIGSGRAGVDCRTACLWLRLPSGREAQVLIRGTGRHGPLAA